LKDSIY